VVYLQESENDLSINNDSVSFSEAMNDDNSDKWLDAMKDDDHDVENKLCY